MSNTPYNSNSYSSTDQRYQRIAWLVIGVGALLRLLLYWANLPENAYDDHFEPVLLAINSGALPALNACWECHQPPLFYAVSALLGSLILALGATKPVLLKLLQFLPCLYGILTLPVVYAILKRLKLSPFSCVATLTLVAFFPRHIYMSAMHTNDTMGALVVSLSLLMLLKGVDEGFKLRPTALFAVVMAAAILIKITAIIVIPMALSALLIMLVLSAENRGKGTALLSAAIILPVLVLVIRFIINHGNYGTLFPLNSELLNLRINALPGPELISFFDFRPWLAIKYPVMTDETVRSFWTIIYGKFWFDTEPKFLFLEKLYSKWWYDYYSYFVMKRESFAGLGGFSRAQILIGSILTAMGFLPLLLFILGFLSSVAEGIKGRAGLLKGSLTLPMAALFLLNLAGLVYVAVRLPHYGSMKTAFLLNSLGAFAYFFARGLARVEGLVTARRAVTVFCVVFSLLVTIHVLLIFFTSAYRGIATL